MYRVVQWATGSMGRTALRRVIDHPDLELAGVYVYDPRKVGVDAGEIARRPPTGVRATNRIEDILALQPDVVLHMSRITLPYEKQNADVAALLAAGIDVISTAGFHHPACHGLAYAGPLLEACKRGGSTLAGVGLNPGFIAERVATLLTGLCAQLDSVACYEVADASSMPAPEFVFGLMGFGADPAQRDVTTEPIATMYGELFMEVLHAVADALGSRVASLTPEHAVTLAPREIRIRAGTIRAGNGRRDAMALARAARIRRRGAALGDLDRRPGTARRRVIGKRPPGASRSADVPNVKATIALEDPDPAAPHMRAAVDATVAVALHAIPSGVRRAAGFLHRSRRLATAARGRVD